jgi:hypothetical protein
VTRRERMAIRRLHRLLNAFHVRAAPAPTVPKTTSVTSFERPGVGTKVTGGVLGASDSQPSPADRIRGANAPRAGGEDGGLPFVPPAPPSSALYWLLVALLGMMICALVFLGLSSQRPRPVPLRGLAAALAPQLKAVGLMMAFVSGLLIYLLILLA